MLKTFIRNKPHTQVVSLQKKAFEPEKLIFLIKFLFHFKLDAKNICNREHNTANEVRKYKIHCFKECGSSFTSVVRFSPCHS